MTSHPDQSAREIRITLDILDGSHDERTLTRAFAMTRYRQIAADACSGIAAGTAERPAYLLPYVGAVVHDAGRSMTIVLPDPAPAPAAINARRDQSRWASSVAACTARLAVVKGARACRATSNAPGDPRAEALLVEMEAVLKKNGLLAGRGGPDPAALFMAWVNRPTPLWENSKGQDEPYRPHMDRLHLVIHEPGSYGEVTRKKAWLEDLKAKRQATATPSMTA